MEKDNDSKRALKEVDENEEQKGAPKSSYKNTFSVNESFSRESIMEKQKSFTDSGNEIKWKYANFLGGNQEDNIDCKIKSKWSMSKIIGSERGINLRSQIVRPKISCKNSTIEVTIKTTMHGTSNLWIFTRYKPMDVDMDPDRSGKSDIDLGRCPVIVINKQETGYEEPCSRVKCMIGTVNKVGRGDSSKFEYFRRQDICGLGISEANRPIQDKQILEDKLYLKFTLRDLAEDGVEIDFYDSNDEIKTSMTFNHQPHLNLDGEMLLAGSGNSVYIKDIKIKRKNKIQMHDVDVRSYDCCSIF